ncbi:MULTISPECIES: MBL fold metallo-hydrolase [unclassified Pedobacter]|uniref:MBL fold metallo-hydrolase n=1 Tax=unclassified Pedobacter TaxID=2628915 RepID=UPI00141F43D6|nr:MULTISPECIES: MBL fold metallo-hydrolase [unclassified Pedobacter]NII82781.1 L-ascorbate metabolism protein UlaG (beta-lactamase superfamily) [Pedobacter sp. SG908]NMN36799.1 L-ascorbate metabolism protein UlaG (beta-lactamase superfamily) [Pedobacter sp. SG918]
MIAIYILLFILIAFFIITNLPVFGRLPKGARLEKIHHLANYRDGALQNQSITLMQPEGVSFFKVLNAFLFKKHPNRAPDKSLPFIAPNLNGKPKSDAPEIIWFGHSSYLIKVDGLRVLVDPVFSKTPSPFSFIGSKAFLGTDVVKAEEFRNIDILIITHDHYDHLDYQSILKIAPEVKTIVTSQGVGEHLERWGINSGKINELGWDESVDLFNNLKITAVPARHFTGRKFKRNQTLWSAFVLKTENYQLFLGGDSGYDAHFAKIGEEFGPFDLALLECGQYNAYWPYIHMFPEETVQAAIDLKAKILMPVHWGKFSLAMHPWNEPVKRAVLAAAEKQLPLVTPKLGETIILNEYLPTENWWLEE